MSLKRFQGTTRTFAGEHIRNYPGTTRNREEEVQHLEVKQYTPLDNLQPQDGDITAIATCATGFPKEMYEPLWDELLTHRQNQGLRIRSKWCVDKSDHGASGVLNEKTQGDDPSFCDLARDILQMVNTFRDHMTLPLIGIGHSMGANAALELARMHPRFFSSLALTDPIMGPEVKTMGVMYTFMSSRRPDLWNSREEAEKMFRTAKPLKAWDSRVMELWLQYGLRETPTLLYPEPGRVTRRMSKAQEVWNYARSHFDSISEDAYNRSERGLTKYPDSGDWTDTFYNPEGVSVWRHLPDIQCSVFYLFPETSSLTSTSSVKEKVERTGSGLHGSGGGKYGRTAHEVLNGIGHLAPFEKPGVCAEKTADWLAKDLETWRRRRESERENRDDKSIEQIRLSEQWMRQTKRWVESNMGKSKRKAKFWYNLVTAGAVGYDLVRSPCSL